MASLYQVRQDTKRILQDLREVSEGLKRDFEGIGAERCAKTVDAVIKQYETVQKRLNNIDTTHFTDEFLARQESQGGGAGGGGGR